MTAYVVPLMLVGGLTTAGVYLLLERNLTRMLLGLLLIGNAVNLLILNAGGPPGDPPVRGRVSGEFAGTDADPLAQGMILTAIVITMGIAAFVLALTYRAFQLTTAETVPDDPEDTRVKRRSADSAENAAEEAVEREEAAPRADPSIDTEEADELDALPGHEGSR